MYVWFFCASPEGATLSQIIERPIGEVKSLPFNSKDLTHVSRISAVLHILNHCFSAVKDTTHHNSNVQIPAMIQLDTVKKGHLLYISSRCQKNIILQVPTV